MKRRKILVLIPMLGLFLSGCTFQEGFATAKSWIGEHIYHPVKDLIDNMTGKKEEPSPEPTPEPEPGPAPVEVDYGTAQQPLTLAEFQANVEKVIDYSTVEEGKTVTHTDAPFYIKAKVKSNEAISDGQIRFTNLIDGAVEVTGYFLSFEEGVDSAKYGVKNAMADSEIVVKGYGMIFKKMVDEQPTKVFEIGNQSSDGEKGKILSVTPPAPTPGTNYGTLENPLTTSEAHTLLDGENPSKSDMFVTGTVKSNTAWSAQYSNVDIVITDGTKDFTIFRTSTFPENFAKETITENSLVGATVVATGKGKIYTKNDVSTYELDQGCVVLSLTFPTPTVTSVTLDKYEMALEVGKADGQLTATVEGEHNPAQTVTWVSSNEDVAKVENGVVHAVSAGTTNIKAVSTVDPTKESEPCVVTVTQPAAPVTLESIAVKTAPTKTEYVEGEALDLTGMVVTAYYSDESSSPVSTGWTSVPANGATLKMSDTSLVVSYDGKDAAPVALTITAKPQPVHAGTVDDPYTISDAKLIYDDLADGEISPECYVTGTIADTKTPSVSSGRGKFDLTDGVCGTNLYVYNINNTDGKATLTVDDIPVGSVVVAKGGVKKYVEKDGSLTFEFCYNKENPAIACELISIDKPVIDPTKVTIDGAASVQEGKTTTLTATVEPVGAPKEVVWTSENEQVATVNEDGVVTGVSEGTTLITAKAVDHETVFGTHEITVTPKPSEPTEQVYKSLAFLATNSTDSVSSYTASATYTSEGFSLNTYCYNNNKLGWNFIKCGRKPGNSSTDTEPTITTAASIDKAVTKVDISFGSVTLPASDFVAKVKVSANSDMSNATEYAFTPVKDTTVSVTISTGIENAYYQVYMYCPGTGSSNGYIVVNSVSFWAVF